MGFYDHPLCILTWKHIKERRRRFFHTIWEITSGVLVFVILLLMRQIVQHNYLIENVQKTEDMLDDIIYSPNFEIIDDFMTNVTSKLTQSHEGDHKVPMLRGFSNEEAVKIYTQRLNNSKPCAVVIFKDLNDTVSLLDYRIGLVNAGAKSNFPKPILNILPIAKPLYLQQEPASLPLMKLQWAIDQTFMELVSGIKVSHRLEVPNFRSKEQLKSSMGIVHQFLILCTVVAPLPFFLYNSSRLINERQSGLKELMKIVGVSPSILRLSHLVDTAILSTIYASLITIMLKITSTPILPKSNAVLIAMTIILHFLNITSLAFITSALTQNYEHANGLSLVIYVTSSALCSIWHTNYHNTAQIYIVSWWLPHAPVYIFWDEVIFLEENGSGATFSNLLKLHEDICLPILVCWLYFIVQLLIIMNLAWYMDIVNPGKYGVAKKWNFLCKRKYWTRKKTVTFHVTVEQTRRLLRDDRFFENGPIAPIAIKLIKVTKVIRGGFKEPNVVALDNVSLDVYKGEITVILGVTGSGKSILTSIVTGMMSATKGRVYVNGLDNAHYLQEIRKNLGLCPQNNLTFDYLTVRENIIFFELLRGPRREARTSAENLMTKLHLEDKADFFSNQLSASGERSLQMACALAGGAEVLVLDEPTINCDAETRHNLWDAMMVLRGDKTILMTTNSIEEANALGDRVALLNHGKLRCFGTPLFLKNAIGTGFNLSITLRKKTDIDAVSKVIEEMLPESITTMIDNKRFIFTLPAKDRERFPKLFDTLEENKEKLGITAMGVGMSLEEMFLGFIDDEEADALFVKTLHDAQKLKGWQLGIQRMKVLLKRNFFYMWSLKYQFIILQIIVPVLGLIVITMTLNSHGLRDVRPHGWDIIINSPDTDILSLSTRRNEDLERLKRLHPSLNILRSRNVSKDVLNLDNEHSNKNKKIIGIQMERNHSSIYHPIDSQLEASKAINVFSNMYMLLRLPYHYAPIRTKATVDAVTAQLFIPKDTTLCGLWSMWTTFLVTLPLTPFIGMLIREFKAEIRYTHFVVGCPFTLHWLAKLTAHSLVFLLIIPPSVVISAKYLDYENTLTQDEFLVSLFIAHLLFLPSFLIHLYALSFFLNVHNAVTLIYITSIVLGFSGPLIKLLLTQLAYTTHWYRYPMQLFSFIGRFSPVFTLSELTVELTVTASIKAFCSHNRKYCKQLVSNDVNSRTLQQVCCDATKPEYEYFGTEAMKQIITLSAHIIGYSIVLAAVQKRWVQNFLERLFNYNYSGKNLIYRDLNVYHESLMVRRMMRCVRTPKDCIGEKPSDDILLVDNLHKKFVSVCHKARRVTAVQGVSFQVAPGESLVLLGHTGAGKTSTLLMIAGMMPITMGDCHVGGNFLRSQRSKYMKNVALIKVGLDGFYTGYENVKMLCLLNGYKKSHAEALSVNCIAYLGLQNLTHSKVSSYNPSCRRRLALTAAMLAAPLVVLLDQPMRSVDPHARPLVTRAITRLRRYGTAVVLTEESLDWRDVESLSSRIAVLLNGRIVALGPSSNVRPVLANGHTARLKLKLKPIYVYDSTSEISLTNIPEDEVQESMKAKPKQFRSSALSELAHRDDIDEVDRENEELVEKKVYPKSTHSIRFQDDNTESNEASSSRADTGISEKRARAQRRQYLTSTEESHDVVDKDDIDDDEEFISKVYSKTGDAWLKDGRSIDEDDDKDDSKAKSPGPSIAATGGGWWWRWWGLLFRGQSNQPNDLQANKTQVASTSGKFQPDTDDEKSTHKQNIDNYDQDTSEENQKLYEPKIASTPDLTRRDKSSSYADLARESKNRSVISLKRVEGLKADFKREFPTSELADEHLSMLIFHIRGDNPMPYSMMFSKLEYLKTTYEEIVEDYTLSEISIEEVYCLLAKESV